MKLPTIPSFFSATAFLLFTVAQQTLASISNPSRLPTPPMGFNNWARFECDLNETLFTSTADAMVFKGLLAAGYDRINIDDCWLQTSRAENGSLAWNETLFPHGLVWLGEYVKARGFKFGIYEDAGNLTCGGYPGSMGYEELDAKTFASWGIDYLKLDGCNVNPSTEEGYRALYSKWHDVLQETPLIFSESAPAYFSGTDNNTDWYTVMDWVPSYGELARHSDDIAVYGLYEPDEYWPSVLTNYGYEVLLARYQQPGYYNDPDFLIPDWPWLSLDEKRSQFALWASFSAPLIISAYIPNLTDEEVAYLTNKEIIAVDQDPLARQATLVSRDGYFDVLSKSLTDGDQVLTVLNRGDEENTTFVSLERLGLDPKETYTAKDLWTGKSKTVKYGMHIPLSSHATAIYRFSGCEDAVPTGMIFNTASLACMTASTGSSVAFMTCAASDEQVWRVDGRTISTLSAPTSCLTATGNGLELTACETGSSKSQEWTYKLSGNLINMATGQCVKETESGLGKCGFERDGQVFGLPGGVEVVM